MKEVKSTIIACFITRFRNGIFTFFIYFCVLSPEALYCPYIYIIQFPLFPILYVHNFILISRSRLNFDLPPCLGNIKMIIKQVGSNVCSWPWWVTQLCSIPEKDVPGRCTTSCWAWISIHPIQCLLWETLPCKSPWMKTNWMPLSQVGTQSVTHES